MRFNIIALGMIASILMASSYVNAENPSANEPPGTDFVYGIGIVGQPLGKRADLRRRKLQARGERLSADEPGSSTVENTAVNIEEAGDSGDNGNQN